MLALARRPGQKIRIGDDVVLVVREVRGKQVRLGIEAPDDVRVWREEIYEAVLQANLQGVRSAEFPSELNDVPAEALETNAELVIPRFGRQPSRRISLLNSVPGVAEGSAHWVVDPERAGIWWLVSEAEPERALPTLPASALELAQPSRKDLAQVCGDSGAPKARLAFSTQDGHIFVNRFAPIYWSEHTDQATLVCALGRGLETMVRWPE